MSSIRPFKIAIPDDKINRLKQKLALTDFPAEVENAEPWARGSPLVEIKRLALYWEKKFDWREAEAHLNTFSQSITEIEVQGYDMYEVHFIHQTSTTKNAIPLLQALQSAPP